MGSLAISGAPGDLSGPGTIVSAIHVVHIVFPWHVPDRPLFVFITLTLFPMWLIPLFHIASIISSPRAPGRLDRSDPTRIVR